MMKHGNSFARWQADLNSMFPVLYCCTQLALQAIHALLDAMAEAPVSSHTMATTRTLLSYLRNQVGCLLLATQGTLTTMRSVWCVFILFPVG
jgi:hypothetical protein